MKWFNRIFRRGQLDDEIRAEMGFHLQSRAELNAKDGLDTEAACDRLVSPGMMTPLDSGEFVLAADWMDWIRSSDETSFWFAEADLAAWQI